MDHSFPLRDCFFSGPPLNGKLRQDLTVQCRETSESLLRIAFADKWLHVPHEKHGCQYSKDTSNMKNSYRLVRTAATVKCQDHELRHLLKLSSTDTLRACLGKLAEKRFIDAMLLHPVLQGKEGAEISETDLTEPLKLLAFFHQAVTFVKDDQESLLRKAGGLGIIMELQALVSVASEGEYCFYVPQPEEQQRYWDTCNEMEIAYTPKQGKLQFLYRITSLFPDWSPEAENLFKHPMQHNDKEAVSVKWVALEYGSRRDFCIADHITEMDMEEGPGKVGSWCMQSVEGNDVGCMEMLTSHGLKRSHVAKFGMFWRETSTPLEMEIVVCGTLPSRKARSIMECIALALGNLSDMIHDLRIGGQHFVHRNKWVQDKDRKGCQLCLRNFHALRRKHHCRMCGEVLCRDCSVIRNVQLPVVGSTKLRLCKSCITRAFNTALPEKIEMMSRPRSQGCRPSVASREIKEECEINQSYLDGLVESSTYSYHDEEELLNSSRLSSSSHLSSHETSDVSRGTTSLHGTPVPSVTCSDVSSNNDSAPVFKLLCQLACLTLHCPIANVSSGTGTNVYFVVDDAFANKKDAYDINKKFAHHTMKLTPIVVLDAFKDTRVLHLCTNSQGIRFFAGSPIQQSTSSVGYICVADLYPREYMDRKSIATMERLALYTKRALKNPQDVSLCNELQLLIENPKNWDDTIELSRRRSVPLSAPISYQKNRTTPSGLAEAEAKMRSLLQKSYETQRQIEKAKSVESVAKTA